MQADVTEFTQFYQSRLGQIVRNDVCATLKGKAFSGQNNLFVGIGYTQPFMECYCPAESPRLALMPANLGALQTSSTPQSLCLPHLLPLKDAAVHGLLFAHGLEHSDHPKQTLREAWRVLQDDGKLTLILPYRRGLWARTGNQPFGLGTPYNRQQIKNLLQKSSFAVQHIHRLLYYPPLDQSPWDALRRPLGLVADLLNLPAGILIIEAIKSQRNPTMIGKGSTITDFSRFVRKPQLSRKINCEKPLEPNLPQQHNH